MKLLLILNLIFLTSVAQAVTYESHKLSMDSGIKEEHLKEIDSTENDNIVSKNISAENTKPIDYEKIKEKQEKEAIEKRRARSLDVEKKNAIVKKQQETQLRKPDVQIGMTRQQVVKNTRWGVPMKINSTRTKYGTSEQWVYWGYKYLYFENGELVAIQQ